MTGLDREKAKAVFRQRYIERTTVDQALDYLETCIIRSEAEAKLAAIAALCDKNDPHDRYAPSVVTISALRAVLDGDA